MVHHRVHDVVHDFTIPAQWVVWCVDLQVAAVVMKAAQHTTGACWRHHAVILLALGAAEASKRHGARWLAPPSATLGPVELVRNSSLVSRSTHACRLATHCTHFIGTPVEWALRLSEDIRCSSSLTL
jgi:hypothetical protein